MKDSKRKRLEAAGWAVGSADEFLGLSPVESLLVDLRLALGRALKERRAKLHISQTKLAALMKSSQSRVAKMEAADPEVSFELLLRGLSRPALLVAMWRSRSTNRDEEARG